MRETFRRIWLLISTAARVSPGHTIAAALEPISKVLYLLNAVWIKLLVDGAVQRDTDAVTTALIAFGACLSVVYILELIGTHGRIALMERVGFEFDCQIADVTGRIPNLEPHEHTYYLDQLQILRDQRDALGRSINFLLNLSRTLIAAITAAVIAVLAEPRLLILIAASLPTLIGSRYRYRWNQRGEDASAAPGRLARHLGSLTTEQDAGMELRVFGLREEIRNRLRNTVEEWRGPIIDAERKSSLLSFAESAIFLLTAGLVLGWILSDVSRGNATPGTVVLAIALLGQLQQIAVRSAWMVSRAGDALRAAGRMLWLRDYAADIVRRGYSGRRHPAVAIKNGITLENVSFGYPDAAQDSLRNVSLTLPADSVISVVGENGAGKSTLIKLLTGLYRPSSGTIHVDGTDVRDIDIDAWRQQCSGAFQDFARFELSVQHAVGIGQLPAVDEAGAVNRALDEAAANDIHHHLPHGLDTQLGATWSGGIDLSSGQWQKLALGRALMRRRPLLLIFDEPTAALDAPTEHALFERYIATARASRGRGAITLLVTHRFSTVRSADLILVLDQGRVIEYGRHQELIGANGKYAELYQLQAKAYR